MTTDECLCGSGMNNTGLPSCIKLFKKTTGMFIVPLFANDGIRNYYDLTSPADIAGRVLSSDPSFRWYPIQELKDVELPTAESRFETAKDGSKFKLADGIRSFKATAFEQGSVLAGKLQGASCGKFGVFLFDIDGNMRGIKDGTKLYPVEIGGWDAIFNDATDDSVSKIMISFDFDILLKVSKFWIVSKTDMTTNPNDLSGVLDANLTVSTITTTSVIITAKTDYGSGQDSTSFIEGQLISDFRLSNAGATVPLLTVSETSPGVYTLTYAVIAGSTAVLKAELLPSSSFEGSVTFIDA